ncbi:MAG: GFA family protein [Proteobacteria bacterium]|nr:GFA family protein [Pseudomonadota bacterium]
MSGNHEGGCECGALRYRVMGEAYDTGYCHCRICQRTSGAPLQAFARIKADQFAYTKGTPVIYFSSEHGQREFCAACGSQLLYRGRQAPFDVAFNTPTLDDPSAFPPRQHVWCRSRLAWFETADTLPRQD